MVGNISPRRYLLLSYLVTWCLWSRDASFQALAPPPASPGLPFSSTGTRDYSAPPMSSVIPSYLPYPPPFRALMSPHEFQCTPMNTWLWGAPARPNCSHLTHGLTRFCAMRLAGSNFCSQIQRITRQTVRQRTQCLADFHLMVSAQRTAFTFFSSPLTLSMCACSRSSRSSRPRDLWSH